jgi:hypothetical protein
MKLLSSFLPATAVLATLVQAHLSADVHDDQFLFRRVALGLGSD